jgi:DNA ligase-1
MNRFAELLDRLAYEPGRNNKLRLLTSYFREVEDPDRGYALAALTGALSFKHAKPGLLRDLITDRTDPVLFALSYDYVGDLSETVALMCRLHSTRGLLPSPRAAVGSEASEARSRGRGWGVPQQIRWQRSKLHRPPPPTPLHHSLRSRGEGRRPATTIRRRPPSPRS